ncbi:MAG: SAM-dependent methyltransferase, partial [Prochlorococcaceae cyanobacterium ETNP1_MAG_8]|nr:SAM-dependent methyltransferase [Prochlorococcaceae cyanobacterium ETNP1_MAG_8]
MSSSCCSSTSSDSGTDALDQSRAVDDRYSSAAKAQEACLCTPVAFKSSLLKAIPSDVVERDYGCGDPTRWVRPGDTVLDLG